MAVLFLTVDVADYGDIISYVLRGRDLVVEVYCAAVITSCRRLFRAVITHHFFCEKYLEARKKMKKVIKSSTMVKPTAATPTDAMWLSNMDAIMPDKLHMPNVYVYESTGEEDFFDAAAMKASLGRALVEYYPFAGRLRRDAVTGRKEIDCNGEGVSFEEAECDATLQDLGDFVLPEIRLVPDIDYSGEISSFPLLLVQVTRFRCGGVTVGILLDHHAADGFSADRFMNTWAEITRGGAAAKPFLDRRILAARNPPRPQFPHIEYLPPPTLKNPKTFDSETMLSMLKVTRDQINALKARCQENGVKYSSYESLSGHVWRCMSKARGLSKDQETNLYVPVDGRSRLQPPLPKNYIGNVVYKATAVALCGELESNPPDFAARKVREALARMDDEYLRSAIDHLEVNGVELDPRVQGAAVFKCPNLGVTSWALFRFLDTDFGWGCPVRLGFVRIPPDGNVILLPTPPGDGGLVVAVVLPKDQMQLFHNLFYDI